MGIRWIRVSGLFKRIYYLAHGDQRGFVAVDWRGEVYSLSRWCDVKTKALKVCLGDADTLPTVTQTQEKLDQTLLQRMYRLRNRVDETYASQFSALQTRKEELKQTHIRQRTALEEQQAKRAAKEQEERQRRFSKGLRGLWSSVTGYHAQIKRQNEMETYQCAIRDRAEKDTLIFSQIEQRREWRHAHDTVYRQYHNEMQELQQAVFSKMPEHKIERLKQGFDTPRYSRDRDFGPELS